MNNRILLATDLDGTLLGDDDALRRFVEWLRVRRSEIVLVYATGRTADSMKRLVVETGLPAPDYVVGLVGTEIVEFSSRKPVGNWMTRNRDAWNAEKVRKTLGQFSELVTQPEEFQSKHKVSYYLRRASPRQLETIAEALKAADIAAEIIYSCEEYLDFVPKSSLLTRGLTYFGVAPIRRIDPSFDLPMVSLTALSTGATTPRRIGRPARLAQHSKDDVARFALATSPRIIAATRDFPLPSSPSVNHGRLG
jgi:hypothetical protein